MKKCKLLRILLFVCLLGLLPGAYAASNGVKLLIENFDYPAGNLVGNGQWVVHRCFFTGGTDPVLLSETSLAYAGYQTPAVGKGVQLKTKGEDASIPFQRLNGAEIYVSMLVNVKNANATGDYIFAFGDQNNSTTDGFGKLHIKKVDDKLAFGITRKAMSDDPGAGYTAADYEFNQTYLIVIKYSQSDDSKVELFVNPDITGEEPLSLANSKAGNNHRGALGFVNLYQGRDRGNDALVDAIRVATSWKALFDASPVELLSSIEAPTSLDLGIFTSGDSQPITKSLKIKAVKIDQDINVSFASEGYITVDNKVIDKEVALNDGFTLNVTLNPKNGDVQSDILTFTSGETTAQTKLTWNFKEATPEYDAENIAEVKAATQESFYTLINPVKITAIEKNVVGFVTVYTYTFKDASGEITIQDLDDYLHWEDVKENDELVNLKIRVQAEPEAPDFEPIFALEENEDLEVIPYVTGLKLLLEEFLYETEDLMANENSIWKEYKYFGNEGTEPVQVVNDGLTYPGYQMFPLGAAVQLKGSANGKSVLAPFQGVFSVVYSSMLVKVNSASETGNFFFAFGEPTGSGSQGQYESFAKIFVKTVGDKFAFGIAQAGMGDEMVKYSEPIYEFGTSYLLVVKYNQIAGAGNDYAELIVNPDLREGTEPEATLKTEAVRAEPNKNLAFVNMYQYNSSSYAGAFDVVLDNIRVASSWEPLFDETEVETAPEVKLTRNGNPIMILYFDPMIEGDEAVKDTINIKATALRGDLTVKCQSEGYLSLESTIIPKELAESEDGFNLVVILDPKDGKVNKDEIIIEGTFVNKVLPCGWSYNAKKEMESIASLKEVNEQGYYTLVNEVLIENIVEEENEFGGKFKTITLKDESGTLEVIHHLSTEGPRVIAASAIEDIKKGDKVSKLCIKVTNANSGGDFEPSYETYQSPDLIITPSSIDNQTGDAITGYVNGRFIAEGAENIKVFDINGKHLLEVNGDKVDITRLAGTVLVVQYSNANGKVYTIKIVK